MTGLLLALALAAEGPTMDRPAALRPVPATPHGGDTRCAACHTAEGWKVVRFAHDRTGFPLDGRHRQVTCKACHPAGFDAAVKGSCAACHRDPHASEFGARCASCHDASSWRTTFGADAHRRTNFPLSGRHAFIPCEECHGDRRDRGFGRPTVDCAACHQADYASAGARSIDHAAAGFGTDCRRCHSPWRFTKGTFPGHDDCFLLTSGPHAAIPCLKCHTQLAGAVASGTCSTGTASCTRCHPQADMTTRHQGVAGYQYMDRKCYECHRFSVATAGVRATRLRRSR